MDEKRKKSNKNALMVFLFALSLQSVSVMIPNIVNQNQLTNFIHFIMKKILLTAVVMLASVASYAQQAVGILHCSRRLV